MKKKYKYTAILTFVISLMMVVSVMFPMVTSAEDSMTSSTIDPTKTTETTDAKTETSTKSSTDSSSKDSSDEVEDSADELVEKESSPAFSSEKAVDGVKVKVTADANVFPEGTTMEVKKVSLTSSEKKLISLKQDSKQSTIKQYSFDITMKNKDGEEIEPDTSKGKVKVSFENELVKKFTTNVYHIDDNKKIDELKLTKTKNQVTGETTGFSIYLLELSINNKTICITPNTEVNLSEILASLLSVDESKITNVEAVNQNSFSKFGTLSKPNEYYDYYRLNISKTNFSTKLSLNVYVGSDSSPYTLTIKVQTMDDSNTDKWISNYNYILDDDNKIIYLTEYTGSNTDLDVSATAKIKGNEYQVVIKGKVYQYTRITSIKFENGVKAAKSLQGLFAFCSRLKKVDLSGLNTEITTNMSLMFYRCTALTNDGSDNYIKFTNGSISKFTTKNVTTMESMFSGSAITTVDLSSFDTSSLKEMSGMFSGCSSLTSIDLSNFKGAVSPYAGVEGADVYYAPFIGCDKLEKITLSENWKAGDNKYYLSLGLEGNWQNTTTKEVVTNETLNYDFVETMAGTYVKTTLPPSTGASAQYVVDGYQKAGNMWEVHTPNDTFHGYCINHDRTSPSGYFDKVEIDINATESTKKVDSNGRSNYIMDYLDSTNYGYKELAPNMAKALVALIYWSEYGGHGGTYNQDDIWHFTNDYSSTMSETLKAKLEGHTYDDIGKDYKLYIYVPSLNNKTNNNSTKKMQNLLSIEGATTQTYAGVQVQKVDNTSSANPVGGATFRVYKADSSGNKTNEKFGNGETYLEFTTSSNGIGGLYRMDNSQGLPVGNYVLEEYEAPAGYKMNKTSYKFSVTDDDNQKVITVGNNDGVIVDDVVTNYSGGGITLKKIDSSTNTGLANAIFTLYIKGTDGKETEVKEYTTDSNGVLTTGSQDLKIGVTYVLRETKAPEGYSIYQSDGKAYEKTITLTDVDKNKFMDLKTISDIPKTGTVQIKAEKVLTSGTLKADEYSFQLIDSTGKVLQTKTNDGDGNITFDAITLSASDMPAVDYQIKEVKGADSNIEYDAHTETVRVEITDDGKSELTCTPVYDSDGAVFTNTAKVDYSGQLTIKKNVEGILGDSNEKFNFSLYLTSDSTDLNARTFNYTLDGESGTFTFNKVETTSDGQTKFVSQQPFKLKDDSKLAFTNLPVGAKYEVKEDDYTTEGYVTTSTNNSGTVSTDNIDVTFTNTKNTIIPTSADTFTRASFWIVVALGAIAIIYYKKRKKKLSDK